MSKNMQEHSLNWSNAYMGRIEKKSANNTHNIEYLTSRLKQELNKLPFLNMSYREKLEEDLIKFLPSCLSYEHMLVLGIGGSALGARALQKAFASGQDSPNHTGPWLWILDNVCSQTLESWLDKLPAEKTIVVCISKSGGTIETIAQYFLVSAWLQKKLTSAWTRHMLVITDAHKGFLREQCHEYNFLSLEVPDNLGGRYSALSAVGLLPAAFLGIDWQGLLNGASKVATSLLSNIQSLHTVPAYNIAEWALELEKKQYAELIFFSYIPMWASFGDWFMQLWAESLGKDGKGLMPIAATGVSDQHSLQQMFLDGPKNKACLFLSCQNIQSKYSFNMSLPEQWSWLQNKNFAELLKAESLGTRMAFSKNNIPLLHLDMADTTTEAAGSLMMLLEITTLFTGWLMQINPLDQPAVELGKRLANARLGAPNLEKEKKELQVYQNISQERQLF